ncbi:hypothetical protein FACS1894167_03570 [Synergistales bacterium]|nr:hypothetical protein FACS1894167_03570 [Synergistales bacterium]
MALPAPLKKFLGFVFSEAFTQFFKYCVLGLCSFVLDASLLYALTEFGLYYILSAVVSFCVTLLIHFVIARRWIFPKSPQTFAAELAYYFGISMVGLGLTVICMYVFTEMAGIYYILSKFLAAVIVLFWNFFVRKLWLYKK